ncbi:PadR family transcriptional regulator [Paenarthrobacter sp. AR 02]|nr:PadR family transcriptional regulator [Paenarthrobacter sp. AR 02]
MTQKLRAVHELLACESDLYGLLNRLTGQGLLQYRWELSPSGPPRKRYELTAAGYDALEQRHSTWKELRAALLQLLETGPGDCSSLGLQANRRNQVQNRPNLHRGD